MKPAAQAQGELHGIQILRAVAALAVIIHHVFEESYAASHRIVPEWITLSGASGVDIFFVISGFIMLYVSFRSPERPLAPSDFLARRFTRIYPLYWLCCLAVLALWCGGLFSSAQWTAVDILAAFTLTPQVHPLLTVSWTLVYEIYFYLVFAMMLLFRSRAVAVIGSTAVILTANLASQFWPAGGVAQRFFAEPVALEFCLGLWLAWGFMTRGVSLPWRWSGLGFALLAAAALLVPHASTAGLLGWPRLLAWGLPALLIVSAALRLDRPQGRAGSFMMLLGDASYALYLTHAFVMVAYAKLLHSSTALAQTNQWLIVPLVVALCVGVAIVAHLYVEKPMLDILRRVLKGDLKAPATARQQA